MKTGRPKKNPADIRTAGMEDGVLEAIRDVARQVAALDPNISSLNLKMDRVESHCQWAASALDILCDAIRTQEQRNRLP